MFTITFDDAVLGFPELAEYMKIAKCKSVRAEWCEDLGRLSTAPAHVRDVKRWDGVPRLDGSQDPFFTGWGGAYAGWGIRPEGLPVWEDFEPWIHLYEWRPALPVRP